jgi:hypothetical protein
MRWRREIHLRGHGGLVSIDPEVEVGNLETFLNASNYWPYFDNLAEVRPSSLCVAIPRE